MPKRERAILFLITLVLFVMTTITLIAYSQGYRFNWEDKKIIETGGFFIDAPPRALITIDEKEVKKVNILGSGVFIPNLLPREYMVRVHKPGSWEWRKMLPIESGRTTEIRNILLISKPPRQDLLSDDVKDFLPAPDQRRIAIQKSDGLWMFDIENKKETMLSSQFFRLIGWSPDSQYLLLEDKATKTILLRVNDGIATPLPPRAGNFQWPPNITGKILFLSPVSHELILYDFQNQEAVIVVKNVAAYALRGSTILFIDAATRVLYEGYPDGAAPKQLTTTPFEENEIQNSEIFPYGEYVFIRDGTNRLLRLEKSSSSLREIASDVRHVLFSSLGKSVLYATPNEIWVLYLEDILIQPFRYESQKDLIVRLSEKIEDAGWYTKDNEHIIFRAGNSIHLTELDGRDKRNTFRFIETADSEDSSSYPRFSYSGKNDLLYFVDGTTLYAVKIK